MYFKVHPASKYCNTRLQQGSPGFNYWSNELTWQLRLVSYFFWRNGLPNTSRQRWFRGVFFFWGGGSFHSCSGSVFGKLRQKSCYEPPTETGAHRISSSIFRVASNMGLMEEIRRSPPGMILKPVVNNGISTIDLNWWSPDFWTIKSMALNSHLERTTSQLQVPKAQPRCRWKESLIWGWL